MDFPDLYSFKNKASSAYQYKAMDILSTGMQKENLEAGKLLSDSMARGHQGFLFVTQPQKKDQEYVIAEMLCVT